jgi:hypothetical protein
VDIEGRFYEPDVFVAFTIFPFSCADDSVPGGGDGIVDRDCYGGRLRGPVTAVAPDRHAFKVMNTWVVPDAAMIMPIPIEVGTRVEVRVHRPANSATWVADSPIEKWEGPLEQLRGRVDAVDADPSGHFKILVLDTWVPVPDITIGGR